MVYPQLGGIGQSVAQGRGKGNCIKDDKTKAFAYDSAMEQTILDVLDRPIVLIGLMGAGKTKIGRGLAARLGIDFIDSDDVIVAREGMSIAEIFAWKGEAHFREQERDVLAGLLSGDPCVIATGGGAVMTPGTDTLIFDRSLSVWLKAELDVLLARVTKNIDKRPLLKNGDPADVLQTLMDKRHPVYARAAIHVQSIDAPVDENLNSVVKALAEHLS